MDNCRQTYSVQCVGYIAVSGEPPSPKPVAIRDTRSVGLVSFRNSEFSTISDSHIPRPRKCPVKGPYTDTANGRFRAMDSCKAHCAARLA